MYKKKNLFNEGINETIILNQNIETSPPKARWSELFAQYNSHVFSIDFETEIGSFPSFDCRLFIKANFLFIFFIIHLFIRYNSEAIPSATPKQKCPYISLMAPS